MSTDAPLATCQTMLPRLKAAVVAAVVAVTCWFHTQTAAANPPQYEEPSVAAADNDPEAAEARPPHNQDDEDLVDELQDILAEEQALRTRELEAELEVFMYHTECQLQHALAQDCKDLDEALANNLSNGFFEAFLESEGVLADSSDPFHKEEGCFTMRSGPPEHP